VLPGDDHGPLLVPIDGILDLHTFQASDVKELIPEYIQACLEQNIVTIRIIHGKGTGALRQIVHSILKKQAHVLSFRCANDHQSGWGATIVNLTKDSYT